MVIIRFIYLFLHSDILMTIDNCDLVRPTQCESLLVNIYQILGPLQNITYLIRNNHLFKQLISPVTMTLSVRSWYNLTLKLFSIKIDGGL